MQWLKKQQGRWGLIFVDPPTFSNARHRKQTFSIQDDHERLLRLAMARLSRNGLLIFSTNFKKFRLAKELEQDFEVREITDQTLPEDFKRSRIHRCFELRHRDRDKDSDE